MTATRLCSMCGRPAVPDEGSITISTDEGPLCSPCTRYILWLKFKHGDAKAAVILDIMMKGEAHHRVAVSEAEE